LTAAQVLRGYRPPGIDALGVLVFCSPTAVALPIWPSLAVPLTVIALAAAIALTALRAVPDDKAAFE